MKRVQSKENNWHLFDANDVVLGRLATKVVTLLMGKNKSTYMPNLDEGDSVVILNAEKVRLTGKKETQKTYRRHSGYPGGFREATVARVREKYPERILFRAVKGMLPNNKLTAVRLRRLHVVVGSTNPYAEKF